METIIEKRKRIIKNLMHTEDLERLELVDDILEPVGEYEIPLIVQQRIESIHQYAIENPNSVMSEEEFDRWYAENIE